MLSRRHMLQTVGGGFGALAATSLFGRDGFAGGPFATRDDGGLHHPPKVRRIIQLFMTGGVSPMDTYDYKPELERLHGQKLGPKEKPEGFTAQPGALMKSPFKFKQHGETGRWVSSVFPHQAKEVDRLTFLMAMASKTNVHGPGTYMMNTGFLLPGFPCLGSWISYGLGHLSDELPTFVVLPDARGLPYNHKGSFSAGFLPAAHQGTLINAAAKQPVRDLFPGERHRFATREADHDGFQLLSQLNGRFAADGDADSRFDARVQAYELAARMQLSAPEAFDLSKESMETQTAYGLDKPETEDFARRCILARRLIERGTRFVQVWSGAEGANENWDNHGSIPKELPPIAKSVDQPIAALLRDLGERGLFSDTLLIWTTEFGRTPFAQGGEGRDHNGGTFVTWLAGAGVKAGVSYGVSDDWAYQTAEGRTYCYDFHATVLHLLGVDHKSLTFRQNGIDRRLTDVHGHVVSDILNEPGV